MVQFYGALLLRTHLCTFHSHREPRLPSNGCHGPDCVAPRLQDRPLLHVHFHIPAGSTSHFIHPEQLYGLSNEREVSHIGFLLCQSASTCNSVLLALNRRHRSPGAVSRHVFP